MHRPSGRGPAYRGHRRRSTMGAMTAAVETERPAGYDGARRGLEELT